MREFNFAVLNLYNILVISAITVGFIFTKSPWVFLFLLALGSYTHKNPGRWKEKLKALMTSLNVIEIEQFMDKCLVKDYTELGEMISRKYINKMK